MKGNWAGHHIVSCQISTLNRDATEATNKDMPFQMDNLAAGVGNFIIRVEILAVKRETGVRRSDAPSAADKDQVPKELSGFWILSDWRRRPDRP
jgi:hypothetical protein